MRTGTPVPFTSSLVEDDGGFKAQLQGREDGRPPSAPAAIPPTKKRQFLLEFGESIRLINHKRQMRSTSCVIRL